MKVKVLLAILLVCGFSSFAQNISSVNSFRQQEALDKAELNKKILLANAFQSENQEQYDVTFYDIYLDLNPSRKMLTGHVLMRARSIVSGFNSVDLDLLSNMRVDSVFANGIKTDYAHQDNLLSVNLPNTIDADEFFSVHVYYHGQPDRSGFGAFGFDSHAGKPMIWTLSEPFGARNWWPCKDIPADKADSVDIRVKVPSNLIVASNGLLKETKIEADSKTYWWQERYPIATYLVSLAIHPYTVYSDWYIHGNSDSMQVQFYVFPDHVNQARTNNAKTVRMIEVFSDLFGPYPFIKEKYGHAEFLWGGGMEHQTITSLGGWSEMLIAHELAHQWWGDMVTCETFHDIWLNEGFATYSEALYLEKNYDPDLLHQSMQMDAFYGPGTIYIEDPLKDNIFDYNLTYRKASWVLHMLRHVVGEETFFNLLKTYYDRFKFKTINTEQFRELCEELSGLELDAFFQQWIYESGHPIYEYYWQTVKMESGKFKTTGTVSQVQEEGPIFEMPIDVTVGLADTDTTFIFYNNQEHQTFEFVSIDSPKTVLLDKDNWILKKVQRISSPKIQLLSHGLMDQEQAPLPTVIQGETALIIVSLANFGLDATNIQAHLISENADVTVTTGTAFWGTMANGDSVDNNTQPFVIHVSETAPSQIATLKIKISAQGNYSITFPLYINIGEAEVLLVDDDKGRNYEDHWLQTAIGAGTLVEVWKASEWGHPTLSDLQDYKVIVWFTGNDRQSSLDSTEQNVLESYLNNGGRLLLSGQNIGYDLIAEGTKADSAFYTHVLHARFISDNIDEWAVEGVSGDVVGDGVRAYFFGLFGGAGNQTEPSVIEPIEPAVKILEYYGNNSGAGIRYADPQSGSRVVYLAFGLEGVAGPEAHSAGMLFTQAINWLAGGISSAPPHFAQLPNDFTLYQNFPNPFNPSTRIRFSLPYDSFTQATIYNTLGQKVRTLLRKNLNSGWHALEWDGRDSQNQPVANGVYLFHLRVKNKQSAEQVESIKMIKLE